jgi:CMP-N-acetylneuraminic acid synthetase
MTKRVVAFVHAKGKSERVARKNLRRLGDRPLFCHAIAHALAATRVNEVVIDSDDPEILAIGEQAGARPIVRPAELASNRATGDDLAFWQASNAPDSTYVVQVIPTAPFLTPASVDRAIERLEVGDVDSVAGVFSDALYLWRDGRPAYYRADGTIPNSNDMAPLVYETTGLYANRTEAVLRLHKRMNPERVAPLGLSRLEAMDINTPEDFELAEIIWRGLHGAGSA